MMSFVYTSEFVVITTGEGQVTMNLRILSPIKLVRIRNCGLQHFNYFWWDSEDHGIILRGTVGSFFFVLVNCRVKEEERVRGMSPTTLDMWLKKATPDDTSLT
jgi:hypothetical protein